MRPRPFGRAGVEVSPLAFGPMRLDPQRLSVEGAARLLEHVWDSGVTAFHSSAEYEAHGFFCEALSRLRARRPGARPVHISKIAAPHFEDAGFSAALLKARVEAQLRDLGAERLDVVQWLVRSKPIRDEVRLATLAGCREELAGLWADLQREGKVGALASFPYSRPFAERVLELPACEGLVTYLGPAELEMVPLLDGLAAAGQGFVAIRPLFGGRISEALWSGEGGDLPAAERARLRRGFEALGVGAAEAAAFSVRFPLLHPAVSSVLLGVSTVEHADAAIAAVAGATPDRARFEEIVQAFQPGGG
jgi:aryl-alcohol dehydrogenase-like predicted oxidoreductase